MTKDVDPIVSITDQILKRIRFLVICQAPYYAFFDGNEDAQDFADDMKFEDITNLLAESDITRPDLLLKLANEITIESLFSDSDGWIDRVVDYIISHKDECDNIFGQLLVEYFKNIRNT